MTRRLVGGIIGCKDFIKKQQLTLRRQFYFNTGPGLSENYELVCLWCGIPTFPSFSSASHPFFHSKHHTRTSMPGSVPLFMQYRQYSMVPCILGLLCLSCTEWHRVAIPFFRLHQPASRSSAVRTPYENTRLRVFPLPRNTLFGDVWPANHVAHVFNVHTSKYLHVV